MGDNREDIKENDTYYYYFNLAENFDRTPASLILTLKKLARAITLTPILIVDKTISIPIRWRQKRSTYVHTISCEELKNKSNNISSSCKQFIANTRLGDFFFTENVYYQKNIFLVEYDDLSDIQEQWGSGEMNMRLSEK